MQISTYFADKLLRTVSDILHHFKGKSKSELDEPASRESDPHTHKGDAALEFIKHICAVLALDQNVQHDILVNLLLEPLNLYFLFSLDEPKEKDCLLIVTASPTSD